jgi:Protein of unknown function (DUF3302)
MTTGFEIFCLCILGLGMTMVVYALVWLHGIPHHIAEANNHPHKRIIHHACWLSLFTLHAIWPLVYLWSVMPGQRLTVAVEHPENDKLKARLDELERRLEATAAASAPVEAAAKVGA